MIIDEKQIQSLREWLASWGDGPNWVDKERGELVPVSKTTFREMLDQIASQRRVLKAVLERALDGTDNIHTHVRAALACVVIASLAEEALEGRS